MSKSHAAVQNGSDAPADLTDTEERALRAYTDVLAVEWDADAGLARIVTLADSYLAVPEEGQHLCPDREYRDVDRCKHVWAIDATRGQIDAPAGWLVVADLDEREECDCDDLPDGLPCWSCYRAGVEAMDA